MNLICFGGTRFVSLQHPAPVEETYVQQQHVDDAKQVKKRVEWYLFFKPQEHVLSLKYEHVFRDPSRVFGFFKQIEIMR